MGEGLAMDDGIHDITGNLDEVSLQHVGKGTTMVIN